MMTRTDIIQGLINKTGAGSYLEVGVSKGVNFNRINCKRKTGVDPNVLTDYVMTSDKFFSINTEIFDVIFIDGLHESDQVYRDFNNSLQVMAESGYIVCHDINPTKEIWQNPWVKGVNLWTGDCWKAWVRLRQHRSDLKMFTVDADYGCGVISKGSQKLLPGDLELTYSNLHANRNKWLNLVSIEQFKKYL